MHPIVPVQVWHKEGEKRVTTYALLDNGSSGCFLDEDIRKQLGIDGTPTNFNLHTMHGMNAVESKAVTGLTVSDMKGENQIELPRSFTREDIPVSHSQIPKADALSDWPYLQEPLREMQPYMPDVQIGLLIGNNCQKALQPQKVIPAEGNGPFAIRYPLGWTINGPVCKGEQNASPLSCNRIHIRELESCTETLLPKKYP